MGKSLSLLKLPSQIYAIQYFLFPGQSVAHILKVLTLIQSRIARPNTTRFITDPEFSFTLDYDHNFVVIRLRVKLAPAS
jgi:hypothetical protein